ncbi:helix-turn-helix domain-containing protein [Flavobacterium sp. Sd200]|uniref:helix-turn-helix domain-containing protein n=1 Tax=Flavobacterium sp. Sd200 TaxID=2692211 RepID=UPI0013714574|nr:helix-turn-helix transcriptional regulator [Flavobacterium sp. Sd200]MXN89774.1 helix-turn-helix domain-containing protein [Flavobacterium sp. Sd200]
MLNIDNFIKRLEILLNYYNISASVFADRLGVQRSSLSHLLSGRNKPSLDFILKIVETFPEVDLYWLLDGKGSFPKKEGDENAVTKPLIQPEPVVAPTAPEPIPASSPAPVFAPSPAPVFNVEPELFFEEEKPPVQPNKPDLFSAPESPQKEPAAEEKIIQKEDNKITLNNAGEIERIVVFYKNGVFKNYNPG